MKQELSEASLRCHCSTLMRECGNKTMMVSRKLVQGMALAFALGLTLVLVVGVWKGRTQKELQAVPDDRQERCRNDAQGYGVYRTAGREAPLDASGPPRRNIFRMNRRPSCQRFALPFSLKAARKSSWKVRKEYCTPGPRTSNCGMPFTRCCHGDTNCPPSGPFMTIRKRPFLPRRRFNWQDRMFSWKENSGSIGFRKIRQWLKEGFRGRWSSCRRKQHLDSEANNDGSPR